MFHVSRSRAIVAAGSALTALFLAGGTVAAHAAPADGTRDAGYVYVLNNTGTPNSISVFDRGASGALSAAGTVDIGGVGFGAPLGSQGSLVLSHGYLFAVDAGSNQISVVRAQGDQLSLVGVYGSRGVFPISLTTSDDHLYVVNAGNTSTPANVAGFAIEDNGALKSLADANRPLSTANPAPGEVQASPDGGALVVTEKGTNTLDTYAIGADGSLRGPATFASVGNTPFGFAFDATRRGALIVSDAASGAVTSYRVSDGGLTYIAGPVSDTQAAPCWVVATSDGRYAYTANAGSGTISGYSISGAGVPTLLTSGGVTGSTGAGSHPLEMALSRDNGFLYALDSNTHTLSGFAVGADGALTAVALSGITLPAGATGLAAA